MVVIPKVVKIICCLSRYSCKDLRGTEAKDKWLKSVSKLRYSDTDPMLALKGDTWKILME